MNAKHSNYPLVVAVLALCVLTGFLTRVQAERDDLELALQVAQTLPQWSMPVSEGRDVGAALSVARRAVKHGGVMARGRAYVLLYAMAVKGEQGALIELMAARDSDPDPNLRESARMWVDRAMEGGAK